MKDKLKIGRGNEEKGGREEVDRRTPPSSLLSFRYLKSRREVGEVGFEGEAWG